MKTQRVDFSLSFAQQRTCLAGHVIDHDGRYADAPQPFCHICGKAVIDKCPSCNGPLRGADNFAPMPTRPMPDAYCLHCGKKLPWTDEALTEARKYTDEISELSPEEKASLKASFEALTADTAQTPLAENRFKRIMSKVGAPAASALQSILVNVMTSEVRKHLGLPPP
jgi:hypothetical protein